MKTAFVSIALCFAATAAHSMPVSILNANGLSATIAIADQCCPFGSYVACVASGAFCIDLCH